MICSVCQGHVSEVMNFGDVALAGAFLKPPEFDTERKYPLSLAFCESCLLLQVPQRINSETLFRDYFYFSSAIGTLRAHFESLAREIAALRPSRVVEIGCNDGVLLKPLADLGIKRLVGVDPATNVVSTINDPRIEVINTFFGPGVVSGKADVVVANNVFAHMPDIHGVTKAVADLLDGGVFIFEVNRLDSLVADLQYDWVYHEHLFYYSLLSLQKHFARYGLEVFDCRRLANHAGSMRYYVGRKGRHPVTRSVIRQKDVDLWMGLDRIETFRLFANRASAHRLELTELVRQRRDEGKTVAGYGACGRANTLLQWCGLNHRHIDYIVDDAPAKQGFYTPGTHIEIRPRETLEADTVIVFAWSFLTEIMKKCRGYRGEMIVPLPHIYVKATA